MTFGKDNANIKNLNYLGNGIDRLDVDCDYTLNPCWYAPCAGTSLLPTTQNYQPKSGNCPDVCQNVHTFINSSEISGNLSHYIGNYGSVKPYAPPPAPPTPHPVRSESYPPPGPKQQFNILVIVGLISAFTIFLIILILL